jgi:DNA-binding MarR family transcriptional regulator
MAKTKAGADQRLLPLLEHLARVGRRAAETSMSPGGLRPRHLIALKLLSERGPASQHGLADALSLDPSNVVGLLNELEERGLITRRRDPADRRRHIVELSPLGEDELACAYARLSDVEDDLLSALSAEERATLYDLLVRAVGAKSPPCDAADDPPPSASRPVSGQGGSGAQRVRPGHASGRRPLQPADRRQAGR